MNNRSKNLFKVLTLIWALFIYIACIMPAAKISSPKGFDKIEHFAAYFILTCLIVFGWPRISSLKNLTLSTLFGIFIEFSQLLIPSRTAELLDLLANLFGASLGLILVNYLIKKKYIK
ncbi:MAG: hypothetical protein CBC47_03980 [Alphaproteobacteria bacterium TMED87]|nr:hypothetical protein [Rhodospirillaceae bacterium]OUV10100.1 MAG: hypothetical protein CBC47_03980 [Alphaproteobacteria bacterium TMED87]